MKILRWVLAILAGIIVSLVLAVVGGVLWSQTESGQQFLLRQLLQVAQPRLGILEIGGLHTDLWHAIEIQSVSIRDQNGVELVGVDRLELRLDFSEILHKKVNVLLFQATGVRSDLHVTPDGLDIANLWGDPNAPPSGPWTGLPVDLVFHDIDISASRLGLLANDQPFALTDATLRGGLSLVGPAVIADHLLLASGSSPDLGPLLLQASLTYDPQKLQVDVLDLMLGAQHLALTGGLGALDSDATASIQIQAAHLEPERLPWALPLTGVFDIQGEVTGRVATPALALQVQTPGGPLRIHATLDQESSRPSWTADVDTETLDLQAFIKDMQPLVVTTTVNVTGAGFGWPADLDAQANLVASASPAGPLGMAGLLGRIDLHNGVATITGLQASTATGALAALARVDIVQKNGTATISALTLNLEDLRRFGVDGLRGSAQFVGDVGGDWSTASPTATATGVLTADGLAYQQTVQLRTVAGPIKVGWLGESGWFDTSLQTHGITASSTHLSAALLSAHGTVTKTGAVQAVGTLAASGFQAGTATVERLAASGQFQRRESGVMGAELGFTTTAVQAGKVTADHTIGHLVLNDTNLVAKLDVLDGVRTVVGVDVLAVLKTKHFDLPRLILSPDPSQTWAGKGGFTLADDGVDGLMLTMASETASVHAEGALHTKGPVAMQLSVRRLPLSLLERVDPSLPRI